jgi:hypothetical protein
MPFQEVNGITNLLTFIANGKLLKSIVKHLNSIPYKMPKLLINIGQLGFAITTNLM